MSLLRAVSLASMALAASDKRGLVFVPDEDFPDDNKIWVRDGSAISWYYNYESLPSPAFSDLSQDEFEFVPMMWGANSDNPEEDIWLNQVTDLMDSGTNITHVLGFNEPDAPFSWGGSDLTPEVAARAWVANFEPLAERGVKLGLPGCTGGWDSLPWLRQFLGNCSDIISTDDEKKNCTWDFVPVHWYDNFAGLASHIGERRAEWPGAEIWITEYAYANQDLEPTQEYFKQTLDYFDTEDFVGRYTYFGAFRSDVSNVGPNAVFLNNDGELTDIGSWYLGGSATGVDPQSGDSSGDASRPGTSGALYAGLIGLAGAVLVGVI